MTASEKFCLKWNDFQENISSSFRTFHNNPDFSDVTLVSEEDKQIEAHRVILSACSPFFNSLLKGNNHSHPMIYMRGCKTKDLVSVVDFIYHGEANIFQEDLDGFLVLADELKLKGLTDPKEFEDEEDNEKPTPNPKISVNKTEKDAYIYIEGVIPENTQMVIPDAVQQVVSTVTRNEDFEVKIGSLIESFVDGDFRWKCTVCGKGTKDKCDMKRHVESHIDGISHPCNICGKVSRSKNALLSHKSRTHRV